MINLVNKHLLYGRDEEEKIVAVEPVHNKNLVEVFTRIDDVVESRYEPYDFFMFVNSNEAKDLIKGYSTQNLKGKNYYDTLVTSDNYGSLYQIRNQLENYMMPYKNSQYLLTSGKTLFKNMLFNEPLILFFDIEVMTKEGYEFPNSRRPEDEIFMVSAKTNRGDKFVLYTGEKAKSEERDVSYLNYKTEQDLIKGLVLMIRKVNPDILVNHNIFNFDLTYITDRCDMHNISFAIGRNGSEPNTYSTSIKFADRSREYTNYQVYGRHVIDTMFLAQYADVVIRAMPSYNLKDLVKFVGKAKDDRMYIEGEDISKVWRGQHDTHTREDLIKYAIDDVDEAEIIYKEYGQSFFTLTQMIPMSYQDVFRYGTGGQVEYVFMREYLFQKQSYPKPDAYRKISGGYADVLKFGIILKKLIYADVKSLYPSLGKLLKIQPKKDELGLYQQILELLAQTRYEIKAKIKQYTTEGKDELVSQQKATDGSVKIFLNTMSYGFLAFGASGFNDFDEAERITKSGQSIIKQMNQLIVDDGGIPVKVDTDGVAMVMPDKWVGKEEEYVNELTKRLPEGIIIECDGKYDGIISFDKKSYALLETDGTVKIKGNTLIGRSIQSVYTDFVRDSIHELFFGKGNCLAIYNKYKTKIESKVLEVKKISKRANINKNLKEYENEKSLGKTNISAQYELAINATRPYTKGDVISFYIKEYPYELKNLRNKLVLKKTKKKNFEAAELAENYDYDYEVSFYLDGLENTSKKFMCLGKIKFTEIFEDKIYPKNADIKKYEKLTKLKWEIS